MTEGLRLAGVGSREYQQAAAAAPAIRLLRRGDVSGVLRALRQDFIRNKYFITGVLTDSIYDEQCVFVDPTISFRGRDQWKRNLALLVPFLLDPALQLQSLRRLPQPAPDGSTQLFAEWRLECTVRLPWRPYVCVNGTTTFTLNSDRNQIVRHVEGWDISGVQALLLLLQPAGSGAR